MISNQEESILHDLPLSQGTFNIIQNGLDQIFNASTPPEPPVTRILQDNLCDKSITLDIPQPTHVTKNVKKNYKVIDYNHGKLICLAKDVRFIVNFNYTKHSTNDLFVRIFPSATDSAFKYCPITCCQAHGQKSITKVSCDMLERAALSLVEINDPDAKYETIELPKNEVQISVLVRFWAPDINLDLMIKCYNTCHESLKKSFPKLNFSIERWIESKKHFVVLSQESIYFKVCASPSRDSKSMTLKKRPAIQEPLPVKLENKLQPFYTGLSGTKYFPKMVPEPIIATLNYTYQFLNESDLVRLRRIEEDLEHCVTAHLSST